MGIIYIRGEYEWIARRLEQAIAQAEETGWLGRNIRGSEFTFRVHVHRGAGAYICGEETALLESLEGKPGEPRTRPPYPTEYGYRGKPTLINNVETLCQVPLIINRGAGWFRSIGTAGSPGTKVFTVAGCINGPAAFEAPLGITLRQIVTTPTCRRRLVPALSGRSRIPARTVRRLHAARERRHGRPYRDAGSCRIAKICPGDAASPLCRLRLCSRRRAETEFQHWVRRYGARPPQGPPPAARFPVNSDPNPFVWVDLNKCILCTRCVRAFLALEGRRPVGPQAAWLYDSAAEILVEVAAVPAKIGLDERQTVRVRSRRGDMLARAVVTDRVAPGVVFGNFHFPGPSNANNVTSGGLDPVAKIPEYKVCAVAIEAVSDLPVKQGDQSVYGDYASIRRLRRFRTILACVACATSRHQRFQSDLPRKLSCK
jgi:hypothetical protein